MKFETESYTVGVHFISPIVNFDASGLDDSDYELWGSFMERLSLKGFQHVAVNDDELDNPWFGMCEVTGLMNSVVEIEVFFNKETYDEYCGRVG